MNHTTLRINYLKFTQMISPGVLCRRHFYAHGRPKEQYQQKLVPGDVYSISIKCRWYSAPIRITGAYVYNIMGGETTVHKGKRRHYLSHDFMIFRYAKTAALCGAKQIYYVRFAGGDTRLILMIIIIREFIKTGEQK